LVAKGLADLNAGLRSEEALLVLIARPRLVGLGFDVPKVDEASEPFEHQLYSVLERRLPDRAHYAYNSLFQRIVSFANAYRPPVR
jgi:hypothetical protein